MENQRSFPTIEGAAEIYTNSVKISAGIYDITLEFGLNTLGEEDSPPTSHKVARIRMSPQHAMALHLLLEKYIRAWEEQFQEIYLPEDLAKRLSSIELIGETDEHNETK